MERLNVHVKKTAEKATKALAKIRRFMLNVGGSREGKRRVRYTTTSMIYQSGGSSPEENQ